MRNKNLVAFMVGIPGSGKSTFARKVQKDAGIKLYVCPDDIRERLTGKPDDFSREGQVWDLVKMQMAYAARTGNSVILDATGANYKLRVEMVAYLNSLGSRVYAYYKKVDLQTALGWNYLRGLNGGRSVPDHVIKRMYDALQRRPPSRFDGFFEVWEV